MLLQKQGVRQDYQQYVDLNFLHVREPIVQRLVCSSLACQLDEIVEEVDVLVQGAYVQDGIYVTHFIVKDVD